MGNAKDFLREKEEREDSRIPTETDKIADFLKRDSVTILEDADEITTYIFDKNTSVNKRAIHVKKLKGLNARRVEGREKRECPYCGDMYIPRSSIYWKTEDGLSRYCFKCGGHEKAAWRRMIDKNFGTGKKYQEYLAKLIVGDALNSNTPLPILREQLAIRKKYGQAVKRVENYIAAAEEKAGIERNHMGHEFDF